MYVPYMQLVVKRILSKKFDLQIGDHSAKCLMACIVRSVIVSIYSLKPQQVSIVRIHTVQQGNYVLDLLVGELEIKSLEQLEDCCKHVHLTCYIFLMSLNDIDNCRESHTYF